MVYTTFSLGLLHSFHFWDFCKAIYVLLLYSSFLDPVGEGPMKYPLLICLFSKSFSGIFGPKVKFFQVLWEN